MNNGIPHEGQLIIQLYCRNTEWIIGKNKPPKAMSNGKTYLSSKSLRILLVVSVPWKGVDRSIFQHDFLYNIIYFFGVLKKPLL